MENYNSGKYNKFKLPSIVRENSLEYSFQIHANEEREEVENDVHDESRFKKLKFTINRSQLKKIMTPIISSSLFKFTDVTLPSEIKTDSELEGRLLTQLFIFESSDTLDIHKVPFEMSAQELEERKEQLVDKQTKKYSGAVTYLINLIDHEVFRETKKFASDAEKDLKEEILSITVKPNLRGFWNQQKVEFETETPIG